MKQSLIIGAGGIGLAVAELLCQQGDEHNITIITSNPTLLSDKRFNVLLVENHSEQQVASCLATLSIKFDYVFCCLGLLHQEEIQPEKNLSQWRVDSAMALMQANAFAPLTYLVHLQKLLAKECKLAFLSARVGSISDNRLGGWYSYRMAKAALNMAIKTASVELARSSKKVCVIAFHPGTTDTKLSKPFQRNVPENKLFTAQFSAECLIRLMFQVNEKDSGKFFAWDGQEIEW
ncbi:SDR family NAD(P)-dependent oxidoreductase [Pseudoalteromonas spongiae]|uniref:SDR family NAD(P)-dependent oxidoreductase n=1 Tax=Pseudoalteromonas spongiae TaxID=298657 RepID=UPI00110BA3AE|nr:SDR family oxidoreductase [Pseudoalteromonas spongiae]TMO85894.1 short chain dehydrogenase [Pseudoalteromonas spongiae]